MKFLKLLLVSVLVAVSVAAQVSAQERGPEKDCAAVGDWARAIANCTALLEAPGNLTDKERAYAYAGRASSHLHRGEIDSAVQDFNEAIKLEPTLTFAHYQIGLAYFRMNDLDKAIAAFTEAINLWDRFTSSALVARGSSYRLKRDFDNAIADFEQAIRLDADNNEVHGRLGEVCFQKNDIDRAIDEFSKAIENSPSAAVAREYYVWRGKAYLQRNENRRAVADFDTSILIVPSAEAYRGRGQALKNMGDEAGAVANFDSARRISKEPPIAHIPWTNHFARPLLALSGLVAMAGLSLEGAPSGRPTALWIYGFRRTPWRAERVIGGRKLLVMAGPVPAIHVLA
jgi:tetratricopeptide (TPR) repeat protein